MAFRPVSIVILFCLTAVAHGQTLPPFKHIIIVVQENRTPDNLFGSNPSFEPGTDIATTGMTSAGLPVPLTAERLNGCYDIVHSHDSFELALTQGFDAEPINSKKCKTAPPPVPAFRFVDNSKGTVQPYFDIAAGYGFANRMFQTNQGPSFPAHQFLFGGTSAPTPSSDLFAAENVGNKSLPNQSGIAGCIAPKHQTVLLINPAGVETQHKPIYPCFDHRTMADLLDEASPPLSWRYYTPKPGSIWTAPDAIEHICKARKSGAFPVCTGKQWVTSVVPNNPGQVLTDIAGCRLSAVSWVIPTAEESDHASINKGLGPEWVASIVNAVGNQAACSTGESYWNDTAILITWDDWGGWYDHVKPFNVVTNQNVWGSGYTYGFRVPLLVVSAYTPPHLVDNDVFDFGSLLYFVEQTFHLGFIGPGTSTYTRYADFQSSKAPFGSMAGFFPLTAPRAFVPIAARLPPKTFTDAPESTLPVDDD